MPRPKRAARKPERPRRSGRRGIGPLEDTQETREEKAAEGKTEGDGQAAQGTLLEVPQQPPKPTVVNDLFQAFFRTATFSKNSKTEKRYIHLHITVEMSKEHAEVVPKIVAQAHQRVARIRGVQGEKLKDIPRQTVAFFLTTEGKEALANVVGCEFTQGKVDQIQKRGEGSARKIVRLTFALKCAHDDDLVFFAAHNFNNTFWVSMHETAPDLIDLDEDEEDE